MTRRSPSRPPSTTASGTRWSRPTTAARSKLYVDGAPLTAQTATRATATDSYGFVVGAILNPASGNYGNFFDGTLDEVSLYNTVLPAATVTNHYDSGT